MEWVRADARRLSSNERVRCVVVGRKVNTSRFVGDDARTQRLVVTILPRMGRTTHRHLIRWRLASLPGDTGRRTEQW